MIRQIVKKYTLLGWLILLSGLCCGARFYTLAQPPSSFPLKQKWQVDLGHTTYERPNYQDGLIFFPANHLISSQWYGIEANSGRITWSHPIKRNSFFRCLTQNYLVVSGARSLVTLRPDDGEIVWQGKRADAATCSEMAVFTVVPRGFIEAIDLSNGQYVWRGINPRHNVSSVIYNSDERELIAGASVVVDPTSGEVSRTFSPSFIAYPPTDQGRGSTLLIDQNELFIGGSVRNAKNGQILHKENRFSSFTAPTVTEDTIYISDGKEGKIPSGVAALDRNTYSVKWAYQPQHKISWLPLITLSPVAIFDGIGYVIFSDATLRAFDLETGQELGYWQPETLDLLFWPACVSLPFPGCTRSSGFGMTTSEDTLFVSFGDGKLYAFGK